MNVKMFSAAAVALLVAVSVFAAEPEKFKVGAFSFAVPDGWTKVTPSSQMRNAQLEVARGTEKAEVTFFHFGGGSGTPADNIARWFGQFAGSESNRTSESVQIGATKITFATAEGTFSSGMPGGPATPMSGYALCGAILEHPQGDVYVKMTGLAAIVKSATDAFKVMVKEAAKGPAAENAGAQVSR